jgi:hypothetical protein
MFAEVHVFINCKVFQNIFEFQKTVKKYKCETHLVDTHFFLELFKVNPQCL